MSHALENIEVFSSSFGWMALAVAAEGRRSVVTRLSFGHDTPLAARRGLGLAASIEADRSKLSSLARRLQAYADGEPDDFRDVEVRDYSTTAFTRRVLRRCRAIGYGETLTYGELAEAVGAPRAARAVGNVMATNRVPLIVPCHRVLASGGRNGGYSMGEGVRLKLRLLEMEACAVV